MKLVQLFTFLEVARLGAFRKAAERLNTTQPAVSARIAALEQALGVTLFDREGAKVALTAKGRELLPYAERMLALADETRRAVGDPTHLSGQLRLGVAETLVHAWLPDFLARLTARHPQVELEISVDVSVAMRDALLGRRLDLAFLMGPVSDYSVRNLPLCRYELVWAAAPALAERLAGRPDALFEETLLTYPRNTRPYADLLERCRTLNVARPRLFASSSLAAARRMALDGVGVGSLPAFFIAEDVAAGRLALLDPGWRPTPLTFTASYIGGQEGGPGGGLVEATAQLAAEAALDQ